MNKLRGWMLIEILLVWCLFLTSRTGLAYIPDYVLEYFETLPHAIYIATCYILFHLCRSWCNFIFCNEAEFVLIIIFWVMSLLRWHYLFIGGI